MLNKMNICEFLSLSDDEKAARTLKIDENCDYFKDKLVVIRVTEEDCNHKITQYIPAIYRKFSSAMTFVKKAYPEAKPINWFTPELLEYMYDKPQEFGPDIPTHVFIEVKYHLFVDQ